MRRGAARRVRSVRAPRLCAGAAGARQRGCCRAAHHCGYSANAGHRMCRPWRLHCAATIRSSEYPPCSHACAPRARLCWVEGRSLLIVAHGTYIATEQQTHRPKQARRVIGAERLVHVMTAKVACTLRQQEGPVPRSLRPAWAHGGGRHASPCPCPAARREAGRARGAPP